MKSFKYAVAVAALATVGAYGLSSGANAAGGGVHWGYSGHEGPAHWGELSKDFHACAAGAMQSPIDLADANASADVAVTMDYKPVALDIVNNGHTVQFNVGNGSTLTADGKAYDLIQIHFHTPSEHVVTGKPYPLEAHFVHQAADKSLAVIGVFFNEGKENAALAGMYKHLPMHAGHATTYDDVTMDPRAILPKDPSFYRYMGSLTTPPCSEGVNWFVVNQEQEASADQISSLTKAFGGENARPAQSRNNRLVLKPKG